MPKPLSTDLRERIVVAYMEGETIRSIAMRYEVAPSSVSKVSALYRETGSIEPRPMGGDRRSHVIEAEGELIVGLLDAEPDLTLEGLRQALREQEVEVGYGGLRRFLGRHGITLKKNPARQRAGQA